MLLSSFENSAGDDDQWISAADLMGGALLIFFLLMLYYMMMDREQSRQKSEVYTQTIESLEKKLQGAFISADSVKEVAVLYDQRRSELYEQLVHEFAGDLPRWNAEIDEDLTVRFNAPEVLFDVGSSTIQERFQDILVQFFPRYLDILMQDGFREHIAEVRIEGHTSSFWNRNNPEPVQEAYLKNMDLSYQRVRRVLRYVMDLDAVKPDLSWLRKYLTANGLSSSRLILDKQGQEDWARSQRVEFRVRTDAETRIMKTLEQG